MSYSTIYDMTTRPISDADLFVLRNVYDDAIIAGVHPDRFLRAYGYRLNPDLAGVSCQGSALAASAFVQGRA